MRTSSREYLPLPKTRQGFWQSMGVPARGDKLHEALHQGLPVAFLDHLVELTGLSKKDLGIHVAIPAATLQRRLKNNRFSTEESDRLFRLAQVVHAALELFEGDQQAARHWLDNPVQGLGQRKPVEMLQTSAESDAVLDLIGRLEHGVIA